VVWCYVLWWYVGGMMSDVVLVVCDVIWCGLMFDVIVT